MTNNFTYKVRQLKDAGVVEFEISVAQSLLQKTYQEIVARQSKALSIKGFRKGKVPPNIALTHLDPHHLEEDYLEQAIGVVYEELISEVDEFKYLSYPDIEIVKNVPKEILDFQLRIAVLPEFPKLDAKKLNLEFPNAETNLDPKQLDEILLSLSQNWNDNKSATIDDLGDEVVAKNSMFATKKELIAQIKIDHQDIMKNQALSKFKDQIIESLLKHYSKINLPDLLLQRSLLNYRSDSRYKDLKSDELEEKVKTNLLRDLILSFLIDDMEIKFDKVEFQQFSMNILQSFPQDQLSEMLQDQNFMDSLRKTYLDNKVLDNIIDLLKPSNKKGDNND